jgi:hypothetical protein
MSKNTTGRILRSTAMYTVFAAILGWLIFFNEYTIGDFSNFLPYLPEQLATMSLDVLMIPVLVAVLVFYIASLVGIMLEGEFARVLVGTLYAAGFACFFALILILQPGSQSLNTAGYLILAAFCVLLVYNTLSHLAKLKQMPYIKALAISATIYIEGQILMRLIGPLIESSGARMSPELMMGLNEFINLGVSIAAVFTLFAVFATSRNPYLNALGSISSNYLFSVSLSLIGALYYGFFMGGLSSYAPGLSQLSPYVEWTGVCIFAALIFTVMRRGMQGSILAKKRTGEWKKHLQQVTTYKGDRFVGFTEIIDEFVSGGSRDRLLVKLTLFLHENRVADDEISGFLSELINYEDEKKSTVSVKGQASNIDLKNEERRLRLLQETIRNMLPESSTVLDAPAAGGGPLKAGSPAIRSNGSD